jgi:hypothetical protein
MPRAKHCLGKRVRSLEDRPASICGLNLELKNEKTNLGLLKIILGGIRSYV